MWAGKAIFEMLKSLFNFLLPLALIVFAFWSGDILTGFLVSAAVIVFMITKNLPDIYVIFARLNYQKNTPKMFDYFEKAYKTGRMKPDHRIYYGYICMREGNLQKAEEMLDSVLAHKQKPDVWARAKTNYAILMWKKGNIDDAIKTIEEVYPEYKSTVVYADYGYLLLLKGELERALKINLEAREYNDTDDIIADNLGQNYYLLGEYEKSREIYLEIMRRAPKFPIPYYNYAKTLYALGEKEEALEKLNTALQYPFSSLAAISREEVEAFMTLIENELNEAARKEE